MIPTPTGWSRRLHAGATMLFPPQGPTHGGVRYVESISPLAPVRALVEQHLHETGFRVERASPIERLTTVEGEHAALVTVTGTQEDRPAQRDLGFVLLDRSYARVAGLALHPEARATFTSVVRELTCGDVQLAGIRQRRFEYDAPAGWQARARGLHAEWFPLEFPRVRAAIQVYPAMPSERVGMASGMLALLAAEETAAGWVEEEREGHPIVSAGGLGGTLWTYAGRLPGHPRARRAIAMFEDQRYVYTARLETELATEEHHVVFGALARSFRPLQAIAAAPISSAFSHWSE